MFTFCIENHEPFRSLTKNCPKMSQKSIDKNFYSELLTTSIHSFLIYLDSVYLQVLFGVSFKRFARILIELQQFFGDICVFLAFKFSRKTTVKFQKCFGVTLFQNSSLTIIWNNLGLSCHKCMTRKLEFRKKNISKTPFNKRSAKYSTQKDGMVARCHKCIRERGLSFE